MSILDTILSNSFIIIPTIIIIILFFSFWRKVPADKAMVITGF